MEQERIIYSLNIEDVQTVASEILDRHLSTNEIAQIEDAVLNICKYTDLALEYT